MARGLLAWILVLSFGLLTAQKVVKKSVLEPGTSYILIDSNNCFKVELSTNLSNEIMVEALLDGEYKDNLLVKIENDGPSLKISTGFHPNFIGHNDKLSAHKVISIALKVQVPQNIVTHLFGTTTNVHAKGSYKGLKIILDDGTCSLNTVGGNTEVVTRSGDINVYAKSATIEANNSYGSIEKEDIPFGDDYFKLTTTTGNIYLRKTE